MDEALQKLWPGNPKLHDIGGIVNSIKKHGFQELPVYEEGIGFKAGNGRIEALCFMQNTRKMELPAGIRLDSDGKWLMPYITGVNQGQEAATYVIDSNNIGLMGGDFTSVEMSRLYNQDLYVDLILTETDRGNFAVSVDGDDLDLLMSLEQIEAKKLSICPTCGHRW